MISHNATGQQVAFTLLEVLVSISILGIFSAAVWPAFNNQQRINYQMERRTAAIQAAQQTLDFLRVQDPADLPTSGSSPSETISVGNYTFNVTTSYCVNSEFCLSANTRHLVVNVSTDQEQIYAVETVFTKLR